MQIKIQPHAIARMAQRGFRSGDLDWIEAIGTPVEGGYFVRDKDSQAVVRWCKQVIYRVERLRSARMVLADGGSALTVYRPCPKRERKLLRTVQS